MSRTGALVAAIGFVVVGLISGAVACASATPIVQERPGNPDDNVCTPCATAAQWRRPGPNPCPCPGADDDAPDADQVTRPD